MSSNPSEQAKSTQSSKKPTSPPAPVRVTRLGGNVNTLKLSPFTLSLPEKTILELYGEPQSGKTLYGLYLCKSFFDQKTDKKNGVLIVRCEKFESEMVQKACESFELEADIVDIMPPNSPIELLKLFNVDINYDVDRDGGRVDISLATEDLLSALQKSIAAEYSVIFVDTLTSVFNIISAAGLKNFVARNVYESIFMTAAELTAKLCGATIILTHEHTKNVIQPYSTIEVKGGKEIERRSDYILRLASSGSGDRLRLFTVYAKRWPMLPENHQIGQMYFAIREFQVYTPRKSRDARDE